MVHLWLADDGPPPTAVPNPTVVPALAYISFL